VANPLLYKDNPIDPISLSGVNHVDVAITGKRCIRTQCDLLTTVATDSNVRVYFRVDSDATAGATLATFNPEGFWTNGGGENQPPLYLNPDPAVPLFLHVLLADESGAVITGGANDRIYLLPYRSTP
jgi:hypothetical protein